MSALPCSSLFRKARFLKEDTERREKQEMQMWMVSQWASTRAVHDALIADKEIPPKSKAESEKDTDWSKVRQYVAFREEHDHAFRQALMSPKHFGAYLGMEGILGEPPPETLKTLEETRLEERERVESFADESKVYFLEHSVFARNARKKRGGDSP